MEIRNQTPFPAAQTILLDKQGEEHLVVAMKATYAFARDGSVTPLEEQPALALAEEYREEPGKSSLRKEAELGPPKVATDVVLFGGAIAPARGTTTMEVSLTVGGLGKRVAVFGRRVWGKRLGFTRIEGPEPFERIDLLWENAFGGRDTTPEKEENHDWERRNPIGRGFFAKKTRAEWVGMELPNLEDPHRPLRSIGDRVDPAGFGFIDRGWEPRSKYAGTYDDAWAKERMPLLPLDFDERFHNAASPDLIAADRLRGDEPVEIRGCTPEGHTAFRLPGLAPRGTVRIRHRFHELPLALDTLRIDADARRFHLLFRGALPVHGEIYRVKRTELVAEGGRR